MDRRGFFGTALAGLGGCLLPQKLKADQWWEERDFVFEGVPGTEYFWPRDRLIHLQEPDARKDGTRSTILVPTFSLLAYRVTVGGGLDQSMRDAIQSQKDTDGDKYCGSHIHVIYVEGKPNQVGLMMFSKKCDPVIDCFADADIIEQRLLKRREKANKKVRDATQIPRDNNRIVADTKGNLYR